MIEWCDVSEWKGEELFYKGVRTIMGELLKGFNFLKS